MTVYEKIKTKDIDELAEWLDKYGMFDNSPWDRNYCNKCKPVIGRYQDGDRDMEFAWCEINRNCRYFTDMDKPPDCEQIIKMWLESDG